MRQGNTYRQVWTQRVFVRAVLVSTAIAVTIGVYTQFDRTEVQGLEPRRYATPWPMLSGYVVSTFSGGGSTLQEAADVAALDGAADVAQLVEPSGLAKDTAGNLYLTDFAANLIRKVAPDGSVSTVAGSGERGYRDGEAFEARFNGPTGIAVDNDGYLYVSDSGTHVVRRISPEGKVETFAGVPVEETEPKSGSMIAQPVGGFADGVASSARFNGPSGLAVGPDGSVYVADKGNNRVRRITPDGEVSTFAGSGTIESFDGRGTDAGVPAPVGLVFDGDGNLYVTQHIVSAIRRVSPDGSVFTLHREKNAQSLSQIAVAPDGGVVLTDGAGRVSLLDKSGRQMTIAGSGPVTGARPPVDGPSDQAQFGYLLGVVVDTDGRIFVADATNRRIRMIKNEVR